MNGLYLLYLDESGNTGLEDLSQPFYVLGGVLINPSEWAAVNAEMEELVGRFFISPPADLELHGTELENLSGDIGTYIKPRRKDRLISAILKIPAQHGLAVPLVVIDKQAYIHKYADRNAQGAIQYKLEKNFKGNWVRRVKLRPGTPSEVLVAFRIMVEIIERKCQHEGRLTLIFRDRDRYHERDVAASLVDVRKNGTKLIPSPITQIIENIHFIESKGNRLMQLADVCCYYATKAFKSSSSQRFSQFYSLIAQSVDPVLETVPKNVRTVHTAVLATLLSAQVASAPNTGDAGAVQEENSKS